MRQIQPALVAQQQAKEVTTGHGKQQKEDKAGLGRQQGNAQHSGGTMEPGEEERNVPNYFRNEAGTPPTALLSKHHYAYKDSNGGKHHERPKGVQSVGQVVLEPALATKAPAFHGQPGRHGDREIQVKAFISVDSPSAPHATGAQGCNAPCFSHVAAGSHNASGCHRATANDAGHRGSAVVSGGKAGELRATATNSGQKFKI